MNDAASRTSMDAEAWRLMHFALRAVIAEPDRMLATRGLTRVHHRVLFFVAQRLDISVGELQATLGVSKQALAAPLRALAAQGLITLRKDDTDARVRRVQLTRSGRALEAQLTGVQYAMFQAAFDAAGPEAAAGWKTVMRLLAASIGEPIDPRFALQGRIGAKGQGQRTAD